MLATATPPEISWRELPLIDGLDEAAESYPETRIGPFDFSEATRTEVLGYASGSAHRASIDSCREVVADLGLYTQPDPLPFGVVASAWEEPLRSRTSSSLFAYAQNEPTRLTDAYGLDPLLGPGGTAGYWIRFFYEDMRWRRIDGHRRYPGESYSDQRHCTISCEAGMQWGGPIVRAFGAGNEAQGFFLLDIRNLRSRLTGRTPWAFQFGDFQSNERGFGCIDRVRTGKCTSCEACCGGACECRQIMPPMI